MQLSPLQSRLAASVLASCLLILIYLSLFSPHFALAADLPLSPPLFEDVASIGERSDDLTIGSPDYEPEFEAFDRSILGRAPPGVTSLVNNIAEQLNVDPGTTQVFVFEKSSIFGRADGSGNIELRGVEEQHNASSRKNIRGEKERSAPPEGGLPEEEQQLGKRQASKTVFFSANTCMQPQPKADSTTMDPPQLTLFVSTSSKNISPGPKADMGTQSWRVFTEGAVMFNVTATDDIYIGISAPNVSTNLFSGTYNFQVAASVDSWFHSYNDQADANLIWVDSDASAALLITHNLTDSMDPATADAMMSKQPYVMFAQNQDDRSINGLHYSYCGLQNNAQIAATKNGKFTSMVSTGMTRRGQGNLPKQQFYFSGLNASTRYLGILAANGVAGVSGNNVVGGGGHVSRATNFTTKSVGGNCEVVFNLPFCNETAYAVPSNPKNYPNITDLANVYDSYAKNMYDVFLKVLAQIPCEAPSTQRYSLARNCSDCEAAYKTWLCSVTIPRCADFSETDPWLQPRAISQPFPNGDTLPADTLASFPNITAFNQSRNPTIDSLIVPGPYKEVLPCDDLCYTLVQSCPSSMGFGCPMPRSPGFDTSYARRTDADLNGSVTCNYPGSAHFFSGGSSTPVSWALLAAACALLTTILL